MSIFKKIGLFFLDIIETGVIAFSIFIILYFFILQPHEVKGNSMSPNFEHGDFLLTDKVSYRFNEPQKGDIIVFKAPLNKQYDYIKRIVALPGEAISIKEGFVFINNQKLEEDYLPENLYTRVGKTLKENENILVSPNQYFVMGDNRQHSSDSRDWGPVAKENIIGKVWLRYWPLDEFGRIRD